MAARCACKVFIKMTVIAHPATRLMAFASFIRWYQNNADDAGAVLWLDALLPQPASNATASSAQAVDFKMRCFMFFFSSLRRLFIGAVYRVAVCVSYHFRYTLVCKFFGQ